MYDYAALLEATDRQRKRQGFLSIAEVVGLVSSGNSVLDPLSTLISASCVIGTDNIFYPQVVLEAREPGSIVIGDGNTFYPQTLFLAFQGHIRVGHQNTFGEGGVTLKTLLPQDSLVIETGGRYNQGATILGSNQLGAGSQVLGGITVQHCRLGAGEGFGHPDPDVRGGVLKGSGTAHGLHVGRGDVISGRTVLQQDSVQRQSFYHPKAPILE